MNSNNDDNVKIHADRYYNDTSNNPSKYYDDSGNNNILPFSLLWIHVQVRVSDDDHSNVVIDDHGCDNDCNIHVIHDTVQDNHDLIFKDDEDHTDVIINHHDSDSNHDIHVNNNTHIKNNDNVIYANDDDDKYEDNNTHVDRYDVGMAQDDENNYSTSLVPCLLSSSGTTSIVNDCDPVGANDHYTI